MVHLTTVPNDSTIQSPIVEGMDKIKFEEGPEDEVTASVYGSRFAAQELPNHCFPDGEM